MEWIWILTFVTAFTRSIDCHMPPVENVNVECHNFQTVVRWNHSQPDLNPRFTVLLRRRLDVSSETVCSHSPAYSCNVSTAMWGFIREDYTASVTATAGQNESQPVPVRFSYDKYSTIGKKCSVDLPPANISVQSHGMSVGFRHPFNVYRQLINQSEWENCLDFEYTVTTKDQKTYEFVCTTPVCKAEIPAEMAAGEHCVRIVGDMGDLKVSSSDDTCAELLPPATSPSMVLLYVLIPAVFFGVTVCVLLMIIRKWTKPSSPLPKSIASKLPTLMIGSPLHPETTSMCEVDVTGNTPLIQTPETSTPGHTPTTLGPTEPELRFRISLQTPEVKVEDETPSPCDGSGDLAVKEGLGETEGSGYEKRPCPIRVFEEMGGEVLEGYRASERGYPVDG